jgi:hypothetical protein
MILLGLGAIFQGRTYQVGTLSSMGPGFFPVAVGVILTLVGLLIAVNATIASPQADEERLPPEWRGWICISLSILAFGILGKYAGLLLATFSIVFISALGDRNNTIKSALVLSLIMLVVCVGVFWWGLRMQFPLF